MQSITISTSKGFLRAAPNYTRCRTEQNHHFRANASPPFFKKIYSLLVDVCDFPLQCEWRVLIRCSYQRSILFYNSRTLMLSSLSPSRMAISRPLFYHHTDSKLDQCGIIGCSRIFISFICSSTRRENPSPLPEYMLGGWSYLDECKLLNLLFFGQYPRALVASNYTDNWMFNPHSSFHGCISQHLLTVHSSASSFL